MSTLKQSASEPTPSVSSKEFTFRSILLGIIIGTIMLALSTYLLSAAGMDMNVSVVSIALGILLLPLIGGKPSKKEVTIMQTTASAVAYSSISLVSTYVIAMFLDYDFNWLVVIVTLLLANIIGISFVSLLRLQMVTDTTLPFPQSVMCKTTIDTTEKRSTSETKLLIIFICIGFVISFLQMIAGVIPPIISFNSFLPASMNLGIAIMPMLLGLGYVMGFKVGLVLLIACMASNLILAPIGVTFNWYSNPQQNFNLVQDYNISIVVGMTLAASFVSLIKQRKSILKVFNFKNINLNEEAKSTPIKLMLTTLLVATLLLTAFYSVYFHINIFVSLFLVVLAICIALIAVRVQSESGLSAFLALNTFFLVVSYYITKDAVLAVLLTFMCSSTMMLAQNTMMDLKTGYYYDTSPKKQILSQFIGIIPGIIFGAIIFAGLIKASGLNSETVSFPIGKMLYSVISGISGDTSSDIFNLTRFLSGSAVGVVFSLIGLPAGAIGLSMYLAPHVIMGVALGGLIKGLITKISSEKKAEYFNSAATGLVIGDAVIAIILFVFMLLM